MWFLSPEWTQTPVTWTVSDFLSRNQISIKVLKIEDRKVEKYFVTGQMLPLEVAEKKPRGGG